MQKFKFAVVNPIKGQPGTLQFTMTVAAENVVAGVKSVKQQVDGSGWIVLQYDAYMNDRKKYYEAQSLILENQLREAELAAEKQAA